MYYLCIFGMILIGTATTRASVEDDVLSYHNHYRAKHEAAPLKLDSRLSAEAQSWAQYLTRRHMLQHSYGNYAKDAVDIWYNEINKYDPSKPMFSMDTGHFTQLVWKGTKQLGVGIATVGETTYVVCRYYPPGNYPGQFSQNVQK